MIKKITSALLLCFIPLNFVNAAGMIDDPLLTKIMIDQLEVRSSDGETESVWETEMWIGKDLNKLWIKSEGGISDGKTEEAELQLLYSRAIARYWDFQVGYRHDFRPKPTRDWMAIGFKGLAPYFFEVDTALFVGRDGQTALRLEGEYEILFTQRLILTPEAEVNFYGKSDTALGVGSGLSDLSLGLRLRYEIKREFAPYIGIYWKQQYGETADFAQAIGAKTDDTQFVIGIRAWF